MKSIDVNNSAIRRDGVIVGQHSPRARSELHVGLKGTINSLFLKDFATKMRRELQGHQVSN